MNDAENFERRDTGNIRRWRWWFNLTPSSWVGKDNLLRLVTVQRQIVCPCPRLNVVYLGRNTCNRNKYIAGDRWREANNLLTCRDITTSTVESAEAIVHCVLTIIVLSQATYFLTRCRNLDKLINK